MGVKINLSIIKKNHAADPQEGFSQNRFQSHMAEQRPFRQPRS